MPDRIRDKADYREFLEADLRAHGIDKWRLHYRLTRPTLHYQRLLRRVEYLSAGVDPLSKVLYVIARLKLARSSVRTGLSIPPGVFGRGLSIAHYGSVVVNDGASIGRYCRIHSATNIGTFQGQAPTLGDYVYIGPGAVLYGGIIIGDEVAIGANAVVGKSFTGPATIAGAPARLVGNQGSAAVLPKWMLPQTPRHD